MARKGALQDQDSEADRRHLPLSYNLVGIHKNGKKRLDTKNPDKRLRQKALDEIVIFSGLRYDKAAKEWNGARIYDPRSGWSFKMNAKFMDDGRLRINGSVMGISEKVYWKKIK